MKKWIIITLSTLLIGAGIYLSKSSWVEDSENQSSEIIPEAPPPPPPPQIEYELSHHKKKLFEFLKECNLSGDKKDLVNACDYFDESIRNKAVLLADQNKGKRNLWLKLLDRLGLGFDS